MYKLYLDDVREQVRRIPTRCVISVCVCVCIITVVLGLKSQVVTVGIRALGLDHKDH